MKKKGFYPEEIIFAVTDKCNLRCSHCYVKRNDIDLDLNKAEKFLLSCKDSPVNMVGFSGGEPFLNLDLIISLVKTAINCDMMFDRIITNGVWWKNETELNEKLTNLYDAGFDGKIGLSWDSFHGQSLSKMLTFIKTVYKIWNQKDILDIQSVISSDNSKNIEDFDNFDSLADELSCNTTVLLSKKTGKGTILLENDDIYLPIYRELQSFPASDDRTWNSRKWFKDDFCEGPGQVLFVHPNGNIAPCCGFANENSQLIIGTIEDDFQKVMQNAYENEMVNLCYEKGLSKEIKKLKKIVPGKTIDICAFCDFVCKNHKS